jgi:hypothetical protein
MSKNVLIILYAFLTQSFESPLVINILSNFHHDVFGKPFVTQTTIGNNNNFY